MRVLLVGARLAETLVSRCGQRPIVGEYCLGFLGVESVCGGCGLWWRGASCWVLREQAPHLVCGLVFSGSDSS